MSPNDPPDADEVEDPATDADRLRDGPLTGEVRRLIDDARGHLVAATSTSGAGTDVPGDARLRSVKMAAVTAMRPVTSHQVPFNAEVLMVLDRLAAAVEALVPGDALASDLELRFQRMRAAVATLEVQVDDLDHGRRSARDEVVAVHAAFESLSAEVAGLGREVAALRAREDSLLRALDTGEEGVVAAASVAVEDATLRRLAAAVAPSTETVGTWARTLADVLVEVPGPVLDLGSGRGEWLDEWAHLGLEAHGVADDDRLVETLRSRGHDVAVADAVTHLEEWPVGSLGAVTAASFADVRSLDDVVRVADAAREALRPGGVLVLAAVHPVCAPPDDPLWVDPRRRRVHPDLLVALAVDRGFAEVSTTSLEEIDDDGTRVYAVVARTAGAPVPG